MAERDSMVSAQQTSVLSQNDLQICQSLQCRLVETMSHAEDQPQGCKVTLGIERSVLFVKTIYPIENGQMPAIRRGAIQLITGNYGEQIPVGCPRGYDTASQGQVQGKK